MDAADGWVAARWADVVAAWPVDDERALFTAGIAAAFVAGYWVPNLILWIIWRCGLFNQWRVNPVGKEPPEELVRENVIAAAGGLVVIVTPMAYFLLSQICAGNITSPPPPLTTFAWQMAVFWLLNDTYFYWAHRLAHDGSGEGGGLGSSSLYQWVHKQHHRYVLTIGLAATGNQSLTEEALVNIPSTFLPPAIVAYFVPVHALVYIVYTAQRMEETVEGHSGYSNPLSPWHYLRSNDYHAYHHRFYNRGNFGIFPWWDSLCGTNRAYYRDRRRECKRWWQ